MNTKSSQVFLFRMAEAITMVMLAFAALPVRSAYAAIGTPTSIGQNSSITSGTALSVTLGAPVPVGNTIIVSFAMDDNAGTVSVADTGLNTYTADLDFSNNNRVRTLVFSARVTTALASGNTITVTFPSTVAKAMSVYYMSGLVHSLPVDKTKTATSNSENPNSGNTTTTAQANELLFGVVGCECGTSSDTMAAGGGFSLLTQASADTGSTTSSITIFPEYRIVSATGTYSASGTLSSGSNREWGAGIVTYKEGTTNTTSVASDLNPSRYGASVTLTATVDQSTATGTVQFYNGTSLLGTGTLSTGAPNTATFSTSALTVAASPHSITAKYLGDASFASSTSSPLLQAVNKATPTINTLPTTGGITYGQALSASVLTGGSASTTGSFAFTTPATTPNAGTFSAPITFTPTDLANYTTATGNVDVTVAKADAVIVVTPYSATYNGSAHTATGTATGVNNEDLSSGLNLIGTTHTNAGTYTGDAWTFTAANSNYNNANGTVNNSIAKANANCGSIAGYSVTYDGSSHTATGTCQGIGSDGTLAGLDLSATTHTNAGTYTGDAWTFTSANSNYNNANGTVNNSIAKANATILITPYNIPYDTSAHIATGIATGLNGEDLSAGLNLSGTAHTNVGAYATDPWTFTSPNGNYNNSNGNISDSITAVNLTISGLTANDKPYDGNNTASLSGTPALVGVLGSDAVTLGGTPVATFADASIGTAKPVMVTGFTLGGAQAGNYTLTQPTGLTASINGVSVSLTVTGITASNKVYDATTTAALNTGSAALVGVVSGDQVQLDTTGAVGVFADKNVGTSKTVTISGLALTGPDAGKYLLIQPTATANIAARDLTVSAAGVNKAYDGTTAATVTLSSDALGGDLVTLTYTSASFADPNVGNGKTVSVSGISIGGADAGNYHLLNTTASATANITLATTHIADTTGVFRPINGILFLKNKNTTGFAEIALNYGIPADYPVVGDWDGNGTATIGVYRAGKFYLRNSNSVGFADIVFAFGQPGDQPIAGDWDGNGIDTIGVYRPSIGQFLLRNSNTAGAAEMSFYLGNVGDVGIAGDWDGDGKDTTGVFRPANGIIFLKNKNETGFADVALNYGIPGDRPVIGDWDANGVDTIGVYRNGIFLLRNSNTVGFADISFGLGNPGDMPIAGDWDGLP